tara:strand:- start:114 stop:290 length:177 start_codon:yes stop_codon:yes gene_type:complete
LRGDEAESAVDQEVEGDEAEAYGAVKHSGGESEMEDHVGDRLAGDEVRFMDKYIYERK